MEVREMVADSERLGFVRVECSVEKKRMEKGRGKLK